MLGFREVWSLEERLLVKVGSALRHGSAGPNNRPARDAIDRVYDIQVMNKDGVAVDQLECGIYGSNVSSCS